MVEIVYLVEKWGEPWNEGYKNLARYIYQLLKSIPEINIKVLTKESGKLNELIDCDSIWIFNYPETPVTMLNFIEMKLSTKKPVVKFLSKKELDINLKEKAKTILYRSRIWDVIVTTTKLLKHEVAQYFHPSKIFTLPPPIPTDYFNPIKKELAKKILGLDENLICVGYCGKINKHVKLNIVMESLKSEIPPKNIILLLAVSYIKAKDDLYRLLLALKKISVPTKIVCVTDVRLFYSAVDLLLYPVEREGAIEPPLTLLEAMSCGTPVAGLKNTITENIIVNNYNGFLFDNSYSLRAIIEDVICNPSILRVISSRARATILENFSFSKLSHFYYEFLTKIVN